MKPDRTIIRLSFPHPIYGTFTPIRVEYEYPLGPEDNDQDALDDGKKKAEDWFNSRYPDPNKPLAKAGVTTDLKAEQEKLDSDMRQAIEELQSIKFKEDAEEWMAKETWRKYNPTLKSIVNGKPSKNT